MPSGIKGMLIECPRCDTKAFLKYIGQGNGDGGYTRWDKFEDAPEGWLYETEFGYLCPTCAHKFKTFMTDFLGDKTIEKWRVKTETKNTND